MIQEYERLSYFLKYYIFWEGRSRLAEMVLKRFEGMRGLVSKSIFFKGYLSYSQLQSCQLKVAENFCILNDVIVTPEGYVWKDGYLITEIVPYYHSYPCTEPVVMDSLQNALFSASPVNIYNYYHWLIDVLPIFLKGKQAGIDCPYICSSPLVKFQKETNSILNLNLQPICRATFVKELVFIPHWRESFPPEWVAKILKGAFCTIKESFRKPWRLLFLDRRKTYRHLLNQEDVLEALKPLGFELVDPSSLSFQDQIILFSEAKVVVGCHGAGLTNLVFMQPETYCIEIGYLRDRKYQLHYENLATIFKIDHRWIDAPHDYLPGAHMIIPSTTLTQVLSEIINYVD